MAIPSRWGSFTLGGAHPELRSREYATAVATPYGAARAGPEASLTEDKGWSEPTPADWSGSREGPGNAGKQRRRSQFAAPGLSGSTVVLSWSRLRAVASLESLKPLLP